MHLLHSDRLTLKEQNYCKKCKFEGNLIYVNIQTPLYNGAEVLDHLLPFSSEN